MNTEYAAFLETVQEANAFANSKYTDSAIAVALNEEVRKILRRKEINFKNAEEYNLSKKDYFQEIIPWIKGLSNLQIYNKKNLKELFVADKLSVWYLLEIWLISDTRLICPTVPEVFNKIQMLKEIVHIEKKKLLIFDDNSETSNYLKQFQTKKIIIKLRYNHLKTLEKKGKTLIAAKYGRWVYRKFLSLFHRVEQRNSQKTQIMGFSPAADDYFNGKKLVKEDIHQIILDKIGNGFQMTVIDPPAGYTPGFIKKEKNNVRYIAFEKYLDFETISKALKTHDTLKKQWQKSSHSSILREHLVYEGINFSEIALKSVSFFFNHYLASLLIEIEMYKAIMKKEKPKAVVLFYATGLIGRMIVYAAKMRGIKTIGIPHGLGVYSPEIVHPKDEVSEGNKIEQGKCPLPDIICVGGKKGIELYGKNDSYKKEWLRATGLPKYDIIPVIPKIYNRKKTLKSLGLKNKKTILFASQPLSEQSLSELIELTAKAVSGLNYQAIVKLHPMEYSFAIHKKIFKKYGITEAAYIKDIPILEVINAVDLILSVYSTVLTEGAALKKPFIILEFFKQDYPDLLGSKKVLVASEPKELREFAIQLLENRKFRKEYLTEMQIISRSQLGEIDGKATLRIAEGIRRLTEQSE